MTVRRPLVSGGLGTALLLALTVPGCVSDRRPAPPAADMVLPSFPRTDAGAKPRAPRPAASTSWGPQGGLVSRGWVHRRLGQPSLRVLDLRAPWAFRRGHLPAALSAPDGGPLLDHHTHRPAPRPVLRRLARRLGEGARTVVLVHAGADLRDHAAAARAYLLLRAGGVPAERLALMQGGYAAWSREGRPLQTGDPAPTPMWKPQAAPRPTPRPAPGAAATRTPTSKSGAEVLWTRPERLAQVLLRSGWRVVTVGRRPATGTRGGPATPGSYVALEGRYLEPAPLQRWGRGALRARLASLLQTAPDERLVLWSEHGLWSSLLWFSLRAGLGRRVDRQVVYYGTRPRPARARATAARPTP